MWADGLIGRRFAQIYAFQRSIKRLLPEQISWLSNGFKSWPWRHNNLLLGGMATGFLRGLLPPSWLLACELGWTAGEGNNKGWETGEKIVYSCREHLERFSRLLETRCPEIRVLLLCVLQIMSAPNYTGAWPWVCPVVAQGMRTGTLVSEGTVTLKGARWLGDGKMTRASCWSINCNVGVGQRGLSGKKKLHSPTHPHSNLKKVAEMSFRAYF